MKFSKLGQLILVSSIGLVVAVFLTACQIVTIDFVYVASSSGSGSSSANGVLDIYAVDSQSGALRAGPASVSTGGSQPVSMVVSANYENIYVANQTDGSLVHFTLALDGTPTQKDTVTLTQPISIAVNAAGTYLFAVSGTTGGTLTTYALSTDGTIGAVASQVSLSLASNPTDAIIPTGVTTLANNAAVYVTAFDQAAYDPGCPTCVTSTAHPGWVFGYTVGTGGALTPATNSPFQSGVKPTALVADPTNRFVYATDFASNELVGFSIQSGNELKFLINGPFRTGAEPMAITIDPRGKFLYVANSLDSTVSAFAIDLTTGTPAVAANPVGVSSNNTDTQPLSILVDPALGRFVYTGNYLGNSVSGFRLDPNAGGLTPTQATPYPTGAKPTAIVAVPHGNHSIQVVGG